MTGAAALWMLGTLLLPGQALPDVAPSAETAPPPAVVRALVLPVALPAGAPTDLARAVPGVEAAFRLALQRHGGFELVGQAELAALLEQAAQDQRAGCDTDVCLARIGETMDAAFVVSAHVELAGGLWIFRAALLDRRSAMAARRTVVRARSLQGLFASLDNAARQLCLGSALSVEDPHLHERLGTTREVAADLRARVRARPETDVVQAWTDLVMERNQERPSPALGVAAGVALAALAVALGACMTPLVLDPLLMAMNRQKPTYRGEQRADPVHPDGTYDFPWLLYGIYLAATPPTMAVVSGGLLLALGSAAVDALDVGRIPVAREGCCRDEDRIRRAAEPSWLHRTAVVVSGVSAAVTLVAVPVAGVLASMGVQQALGLAFRGNVPWGSGPTAPVTRQTWIGITAVGAFVSVGGLLGSLVAVGAVAVAATLGLAASERGPLVD